MSDDKPKFFKKGAKVVFSIGAFIHDWPGTFDRYDGNRAIVIANNSNRGPVLYRPWASQVRAA